MRFFSLLALFGLLACSVAAPDNPTLPMGDAGANDGGPVSGDAVPSTQDGGNNTVCNDDRLELNNTMASATTFTRALDTQLVACPGNEDWYLLRLDDDERAKLSLEHDGAGDINMQILDEDGDMVIAAERSARGMYTNWVAGPAQIYVLVTNPARRASNYSLEWYKEEIGCDRDRFENNNSASAAERITGGQFDNLTFCGDDDYYRFTAPADSSIVAHLRGVAGLTLELLDESGERNLRTASADDEGLSLSYRTDEASAFLLRVTGSEETNGDYSLILLREVEGNNSCDQAQTVVLQRNEEVTIEGSTRDMDNTYVPSCGHDDDRKSAAADAVYAVVVPEGGGTLTVTMEARTERFDTVLSMRSACADEDSEIICNDDHRGGRGLERTDSRISREVEAGTYYVFADGFGTSAGNFEMNLLLEWEEPETGPACETAQAIEVNERGRVVLPVSNRNAMRQYQPRTCAERSGEQGRERAYTFTIEQAAELTAYTGDSDDGDAYDTVLYLLRGCGGLDEIACHDDISRGNKLSRLEDVELRPGTYTIVADGFYDDDIGVVSLTLELAAP